MTRRVTIAIDAMGGDHGSTVTVPAALACASSKLRIILVGQEPLLQAELHKYPQASRVPIAIRHAPQQVEMNESPTYALRSKKQSSMRVALNLVEQGDADACVSAGNTGALMATAKYVLKTLPGICRPAICTRLPTLHGQVRMLDLGANVDSRAEHLLQFAIMGSVLCSAIDKIERPRVALLNIGEEEIKGNEQVKEAARLLGESDLNYIGFVEGDGVFVDPVDVVVCDGFVGNVALKTSEGVARLIQHFAHQAFRRSWFSRVSGWMASPVLRRLSQQIDPRCYNGASLLGLTGIVVKSHGSVDIKAFANAIRVAQLESYHAVPQDISRYFIPMESERQVL
jgi:glycerol-3-phosphate acyltransferase PlsX